MGREAQRLHLPVKTQCFVHLGISCELGNRKNGTGDRQEAYTCEKPIFAQFGIRSAACRVMFPQQSLETKRCETSERETVDGQNIQPCSTHYVEPPHPEISMFQRACYEK